MKKDECDAISLLCPIKFNLLQIVLQQEESPSSSFISAYSVEHSILLLPVAEGGSKAPLPMSDQSRHWRKEVTTEGK